MPNHCFNRVSFYSDNEEHIKELYEIFESGTNPYVDKTVFGQIIPEPNWAEIPLNAETVQEYKWDKPRGEVGELPYNHVDEKSPFMNGLRFKSTNKQDDRWYNWRVANWGTKWDCYDLSIDEDEQELNLEFNTAWSPPEEICHALKEKFEDADIQWFYDEPGMEFAGYL